MIMRSFKNLLKPTILLIIAVAISIYFRPLLIIDETRYIGVAWEMYNSGNYFVPTLNSIPYDHKPPLLFWLINIFWSIFGVNDTIIRIIPLIFAIGLMVVGVKIYRLLWEDDRYGEEIFPWVLVGSTLFIFYSSLLMFDLMLSFWVALAIYGGIRASRDDKFSSYLILTLAIGFGILAKSPVILAHILFLYLLVSFWSEGRVKKSFYIKGLLAVVAGVLIALIWAIPAAKMGGEKFAYGIFWGQYAGRVVDSFAHKRPFWWYIPWIPIIMMPWILYQGFWSGVQKLIKKYYDSGIKLLVTWIIGALIIFSIISGKQLAYIAPEILAFVLLITRSLSINKDKIYKPYLISAVLIVFGIAIASLPFVIKGYFSTLVDIKAVISSSILLIVYAIFLLIYKFKNQKAIIKAIAIISTLIFFVIHFNANIYFKQQNLVNISKKIASFEKRGIKVAHYGKYNDQFHFFGRLKEPLIIVKNQRELDKYIKEYPNGAIITYLKRDIKYNKDAIISKTKFRTQNALLVDVKKWDRLLKN